VRRSIIALASALALVTSLGLPALADPGSLDKFFSDDGRQTAFPKGATGYAVAIDKQGRILVAGYTLTAKTDFALARFMPNGKPDPDFGGGDGRVTTDLGGTDYAFDVAVQSDGKIVVAGERDKKNGTQFAVVRYGIHGLLDKTFSKDGMNFVGFGKKYQGANAIAIGAAGNILLGGFTSNGTLSRWAMARFTPNGTLDQTFGHEGKVSIDTSPTDEQIEDLALVSNGKIVAAGYEESSLTPRFAIAQFLGGGKLDKAFGHDGVNTVDLTKGSDIAYGLTRQSDGKLIVVGYADNGGRGDWGMVRFGPKGRLDDSFGNKGKVVTHITGAYEYAYGVAVQANGKIVVVGRAVRDTADFGVFRYKVQGKLDGSFGHDGKVFTDFFTGADTARGVALQDNGKIVVAGDAAQGGTSRIAVARYLKS
jgi:uncharacterized delta-60 repeat protein